MDEMNKKCSELSGETLLLYAYEDLDPEQAESVKAHLDGCAECLAELMVILEVREAVHDPGMPVEPAPAVLTGLQLGAREQIHRQPWLAGVRQWISRPLSRARVMTAVTAMTVIILAAFWYVRQDIPDTRQAPDESFDIALLASELDAIESIQDELWNRSNTSVTNGGTQDKMLGLESEPYYFIDNSNDDISSELSDIEEELEEIQEIFWL